MSVQQAAAGLAARRALAANALKSARRERPEIPFAPTRGATARGLGVEIEYVPAPTLFPGLARQETLKALHKRGLTPRRPEDTFDPATQWHLEDELILRGDVLLPGGEMVSPILRADPKSWKALAQVTKTLTQHGAATTRGTGGHVHVGVGDFGNNLRFHQNLLSLVNAFRRELYELAGCAETGGQRNVFWAGPNGPPDETLDVEALRAVHSGKHVGLNFSYVDGSPDSHVEFRLWGGSLNPAVIQARVKLSLALVELATKPKEAKSLIALASKAKSKKERMAIMLAGLFERPEDIRQIAALRAQIRAKR